MFHPLWGWQLFPSFIPTAPGQQGGPYDAGNILLGWTAQECGTAQTLVFAGRVGGMEKRVPGPRRWK